MAQYGVATLASFVRRKTCRPTRMTCISAFRKSSRHSHARSGCWLRFKSVCSETACCCVGRFWRIIWHPPLASRLGFDNLPHPSAGEGRLLGTPVLQPAVSSVLRSTLGGPSVGIGNTRARCAWPNVVVLELRRLYQRSNFRAGCRRQETAKRGPLVSPSAEDASLRR